ncbi:hypothetical protein JIN82_10600 [Persicirhabdus sediminis]|uniref:Transcriptional regulator n=2 Tax=Persicirhabdus sediminis TaxID=454144 RepID=A0A8J7MF64_9BACT|nr:hypothetical protein [Persicirhabdus sediminis]
MSVAELSRAMEMSYMGVKQHCVKLQDLGYLETWRVPRVEVGRPQKMYKLTKKCEPLFPKADETVTLALLEAVKLQFGDAGPEKLLFRYYDQLGDKWLNKVRVGKSLVERATKLAELRDQSGCFSRCLYTAKEGFRIEEYHHPMQKIFDLYPAVITMEVRMMEKLIGSQVVRTVKKGTQGVRCVTYQISTLG